MALIPDSESTPTMRTREEVLEQLRAVRKQYRRGFGPQRNALRVQNEMLCWVLGASRPERRLDTFLGGILNVDF